MGSQADDYKPTPSPAPLEGLNFPQAICEVKVGNKVTRLSWNNPKEFILLSGGKLCIMKADGPHPLIVSDGDMFGEDWVVVR